MIDRETLAATLRLLAEHEHLGRQQAYIVALIGLVEEGTDLDAWTQVDLYAPLDGVDVADEAAARDMRLRRLEQARGGLIFAPIAVTWAGIAFAAHAYASSVTAYPEYRDASFIALWENGFPVGLSIPLSVIAFIDALLIATVLVMTVWAWGRRDRIEVEAGGAEHELRAAVAQVALFVGRERLDSPARFQEELSGAAASLGSMLGEVTSASQALENTAQKYETAAVQLGAHVESLRSGVDSLDQRMHAAEVALRELHEVALGIPPALAKQAESVERAATSTARAAQPLEMSARSQENAAATLASTLTRVDEIVESASRVSLEASEAIAQERKAYSRMASGVTKTVGSLHEFGARTEQLVGALTEAAASFERLSGSTARQIAVVERPISHAAEALETASSAQHDAAGALRANTEILASSIDDTRKDLRALQETVMSWVAEMEAARVALSSALEALLREAAMTGEAGEEASAPGLVDPNVTATFPAPTSQPGRIDWTAP